MLGNGAILMKTQPHPIKIQYQGEGIFKVIEKNGQVLHEGSVHDLIVDDKEPVPISQPRQDIGGIAVQLSLQFPTKQVSKDQAIFYVDWWGNVYPGLPIKDYMDNQEAKNWWDPNLRFFTIELTYENERNLNNR